MMDRFSGEKGFTGKDVEQVIKEVCGCDIHSFFENYVRGDKPVDLDKYLRLAGLEYSLAWKEAEDRDKKPVPDYRLYSFVNPSETAVRLWVTDPEGNWAKAGLHTGDIITAANGKPIINTGEFRQLIRSMKVGDTITMEIKRSDVSMTKTVVVRGFKQSIVHISELKTMNTKQRNILENWLSGN